MPGLLNSTWTQRGLVIPIKPTGQTGVALAELVTGRDRLDGLETPI
jgi:hypothetical protein